jgi:hypothetical protein
MPSEVMLFEFQLAPDAIEFTVLSIVSAACQLYCHADVTLSSGPYEQFFLMSLLQQQFR